MATGDYEQKRCTMCKAYIEDFPAGRQLCAACMENTVKGCAGASSPSKELMFLRTAIKKAGKLAIAVENVFNSTMGELSHNMSKMKKLLDEYNEIVFEDALGRGK